MIPVGVTVRDLHGMSPTPLDDPSAVSDRPAVSIVIGSNGAPGSVEGCLAALEHQREGVEVLVCEPQPTPEEVRGRYPWARFLERPGALVPLLWRDGIDASRGEVVALTISPMRPAPDWVATIRRRLAAEPVLAGAIDPGSGLRLSDWAEYFCRYAKDMRPFPEHETADLPGDNCAYRRDALDRAHDVFRDGFWEPVVNRRLADEGMVLRHSPALVVYQGRSAGWRAFARQRLVHGRAHGGQRGATFSPLRNVLGVLGAPAVPFLLTARVLVEVSRRRRARLRAALALPHMALFNVAWAIGEARGHLAALRPR